MNQARNMMIAGLTDGLEPVRAFNPRDGFAMLGLASLAVVAIVHLTKGLWFDGLGGTATPFFWLANGLILVLGLAAAATIIHMASPWVGNRHETPVWASAMVGVLPITVLISALSHNSGVVDLTDEHALGCVTASIASAFGVGGALVLWLRRGAPVSPNLAGWFTGIAAGALGTVYYGVACPTDTMAHLGIWHIVPIIISAMVGRLVVPSLIDRK